MFCTGGVRCEKASNFMLQNGFDEVYHLKGGILKYLEEVPVEDSKWKGEHDNVLPICILTNNNIHTFYIF